MSTHTHTRRNLQWSWKCVKLCAVRILMTIFVWITINLKMRQINWPLPTVAQIEVLSIRSVSLARARALQRCNHTVIIVILCKLAVFLFYPSVHLITVSTWCGQSAVFFVARSMDVFGCVSFIGGKLAVCSAFCYVFNWHTLRGITTTGIVQCPWIVGLSPKSTYTITIDHWPGNK